MEMEENLEEYVLRVIQELGEEIGQSMETKNSLMEELLSDSDDDVAARNLQPLNDDIDGMFEEYLLQVVQDILDDLAENIDLENAIIEELLLDDASDDDVGDAEDANNALYIDRNLEPEDLTQKAVMAVIETVVEDIQQFDEEEDFFLEGERTVLDSEFKNLSIVRFQRLEDPYFQQHFRMNKETFEVLVQEIGNHLLAQNRLNRLRTGLDVCLLMCVWIMGNLPSFRGTGAVFGVSRSVVHFHYLVVIEALRELASKFIKWPTAHERNQMKAAIEEKTGFPGVIGMMDGTLVKVTAPNIQRERYFDRHHSYSCNVLAVCDKNRMFRHVYVGEPGSVHDSRVFKRTSLFDIFLERADIISDDEHILADRGYMLTSKVLVPYRDNGRVMRRQRRFKYVHSIIPVCIERAFGHLKEKMRRLYRLHTKNFNYAVDYIMASFVLHNFILLGGSEPDGIRVEVQPNQVNNDQADEEHPLLNGARRAGIQKRDAIALIVED